MFWIGILTGVTACLLTPVARRLSWRLGAVDVPRDGRRMHQTSMPRAGGLALFPALLLGALLLPSLSHTSVRMLCGAGLMLAVGLADDILSLPAWVKLLFQVAVVMAGVFGMESGSVASAAWSVLWVVTLINAHNFVDGMDGLLAGCVGVEGCALSIALLLQGYSEAAALALFLAMASLGFRVYNRYPASVFAGDCGSEMAGYCLGVLSLALFSGEGGGSHQLLSPFFLFAYPLADLSLSVLRRLARGKSPFAADKGHLHHRIYAAGLSQVGCVRMLLGLTMALSIIGVLLSRASLWWGASAVSFLTAIWMMYLRRQVEQIGGAQESRRREG